MLAVTSEGSSSHLHRIPSPWFYHHMVPEEGSPLLQHILMTGGENSQDFHPK